MMRSPLNSRARCIACAMTPLSSARAEFCRLISFAVSAFTSKRNMERREMDPLRALIVGVVIASSWGLASAVTPGANDPLESAKEAIRIKEYPRASAELERAAAKGNVEAQYLLGAFALNGLL